MMNDAFFMPTVETDFPVKKQKASTKMAMKNTRNSNSLNFIGEIDKVAVAKSKAIANASRSIQEDDGTESRAGLGRVGEGEWRVQTAKQSTCTSTGILRYMYLSFFWRLLAYRFVFMRLVRRKKRIYCNEFAWLLRWSFTSKTKWISFNFLATPGMQINKTVVCLAEQN